MSMAPRLRYEGGSYRDREGRVFYGESGEVYRALSRRGLAQWQTVRETPFFERAIARGQIVQTDSVACAAVEAEPIDDGWAGVLRHEKIPFVSYPYEWTFGMLKDAALLHLALLQAALDDGMTIKDGTAYNVQFVGQRPTFIDVASFEQLTPGQPWSGYRQFCQTFLFPLFLQAYKNVHFHSFLRGSLDGVNPSECARLMSLRDRLRPGVLTHVCLHARFESDRRINESDVKQALPRAGFEKTMIKNNAAGLERIIRRLNWRPAGSKWSSYADRNSYSAADQRRKAAFVRDAVADHPARLVWDLGCNTGEYSRIAAEHGCYVVSLDADHLSVERLYQSLKANPVDVGRGAILPLVCNLADPSPNLGWHGRERKSLENRGLPDLTLCLALVHHLVVDAGIPVREFVEWLAGLKSHVVIEFVDRSDPMVQVLLRNRHDPCADYDRQHFENCLNGCFDIVRSEQLESGTRRLYFALNRRGATNG
jgi:hypothetical protein